jgi:hypothetical protein
MVEGGNASLNGYLQTSTTNLKLVLDNIEILLKTQNQKFGTKLATETASQGLEPQITLLTNLGIPVLWTSFFIGNSSRLLRQVTMQSLGLYPALVRQGIDFLVLTLSLNRSVKRRGQLFGNRLHLCRRSVEELLKVRQWLKWMINSFCSSPLSLI